MTTNIEEASLTELDKMKEAIDNLKTTMKKVRPSPQLPNMDNTALCSCDFS